MYIQELLKYIHTSNNLLRHHTEISSLLKNLATTIRDMPGFACNHLYICDSQDFYPIYPIDNHQQTFNCKHIHPLPLSPALVKNLLYEQYQMSMSYIYYRDNHGTDALRALIASLENSDEQAEEQSSAEKPDVNPDVYIHTVLIVPFLDETQKLRGLLLLINPSYDVSEIEDALPLLELFADRISLVMHFTHLLEERATLSRIGNMLTSPEYLYNLQKVYRVIYEEVKQLMPVDSFFIDRYDAHSDTIFRDFTMEGDADPTQIHNSHVHPVMKRFLYFQPPYIFFSTKEEFIGYFRQQMSETMVEQVIANHPEILVYQSKIFAIIRYNDEPIGVLGVQSYEPLSYRREHLQLLVALARQVAVAIKSSLIYNDLLDALQKAQESERLKNHFLMTASHELRTPLTTIQGYLELLNDFRQSLDEDLKTQFIDQARHATEELVLLVNTIMDAGRIDQNELDLQLHSVNLAQTVHTILEILDPIITKEHRPVTVDVPQHLSVCADSLRLRQILLNLMNNALKYTAPPTKITIFTAEFSYEMLCTRFSSIPRVASLSTEKNYAAIAVRDWGPGIPEKEQGNLFTKFMRLNPAINSTQRGAGLGLYLCRRLSEAMDGTVWLESSGIPGEGCTFWLVLPVA